MLLARSIDGRKTDPGAPAPAADAGCFSRHEATILFADLRGFSAVAALYPPEVLVPLLNRRLGVMAEVVMRHGGTIDKFMGDAIMAVFPEDPSTSLHHARRAVAAAVEMQIEMNRLREQDRSKGLPEMYVGIGMSSGPVVSALIGSELYRAHTVIGDDVNIASRVEALSLRGQVLVSESTYAHCEGYAEVGPPLDVHVKGRGTRLRVREVLAILGAGPAVPRQDLRKSPRVPVDLKAHYWRVVAKVVAARRQRGVLRDIGYHGVRMELGRPLPLYAELKLGFDLPEVGFSARDIFARVVSVHKHWGARCIVGLEFTSLGEDAEREIRDFVALRLQRRPHETASAQP